MSNDENREKNEEKAAVPVQPIIDMGSTVVKNSPVRMSGTVIAAPETYRYFERLQERIIQFVAANSRVTAERFRELMLSSGDMANDVGTVLYGEQAVAEGIIDRIGTLGDALEALYGQIERRHG